jgi:hypothetical protein
VQVRATVFLLAGQAILAGTAAQVHHGYSVAHLAVVHTTTNRDHDPRRVDAR